MEHSSITSYFLLLVRPPSLPQWKSIEEADCWTARSEERQQLMDGTEEEERDGSTRGTCRSDATRGGGGRATRAVWSFLQVGKASVSCPPQWRNTFNHRLNLIM